MTISWLAPFYLWTKSFHVISLIAWMAALFYLPRLFVYHTQMARGSAESERFKVMERRLARGIMGPAMHATWLFGILLVLTPGVVDWSAPWWHVKLTCVILMLVFHMALNRFRKDFLHDRNTRPEKFYRIINEVPTILMIAIVISVIVKY